MPYLNVRTNRVLERETESRFLKTASRHVAELLGKSERYVMVELVAGSHLLFGGSDQPAAYVELKSIGLPGEQTRHLSESLCQLLSQELSLDPVRIYIEFTDIPRTFWGWNGSTF